MSSTDGNREFVTFGYIALILGILEIFFLFFTLFFMFGAFFMAPLILGLLIGIMIFRFIAAGFLRKANKIFNSYRLGQFISKMCPSIILFFIGTLIVMVGRIGLASWSVRDDATTAQLAVLIFTMIIGIFLVFLSGFIEYQAWDRLQMFFDQNQSSFPPSIANSGSSSASLLKIGGLLNIFIVLIVIGSILRIIGFLKLLSLKKLRGEQPISVPTAQPAPVPAPTPAPAPAAEPTKTFCPDCGSPVTGQEKFCAACGSRLS